MAVAVKGARRDPPVRDGFRSRFDPGHRQAIPGRPGQTAGFLLKL